MATAGRWRGVTAFAVGALVAWLAAEGHRVASGAAPSTGSMMLAAGVVAMSALVGMRLPWTCWRVVATIAVLQPMMHFVFSTFPADAAAHVHGHHDMSGSSSGWTMVAAHVVATVVAAVLLRAGGRWLVRMPECVRAISLFVRWPAVWPLVALPARAPATIVPVVSFTPEVRNSRGPPR